MGPIYTRHVYGKTRWMDRNLAAPWMQMVRSLSGTCISCFCCWVFRVYLCIFIFRMILFLLFSTPFGWVGWVGQHVLVLCKPWGLNKVYLYTGFCFLFFLDERAPTFWHEGRWILTVELAWSSEKRVWNGRFEFYIHLTKPCIMKIKSDTHSFHSITKSHCKYS